MDTTANTVSQRPLSHRCCEFSTLNPGINGRPYRHAYVPASAIDDPVKWGPNQVRRSLAVEFGRSAASSNNCC